MIIITEVPETMDRGTRNGVWNEFLHCGNENIPRSRPRNSVPGTWNAPSFHKPGDYAYNLKSVMELLAGAVPNRALL